MQTNWLISNNSSPDISNEVRQISGSKFFDCFRFLQFSFNLQVKFNLAKAAQRELLPNLIKILLRKPTREIAAESHQYIAAKAAQRELLPNLTKILLSKPSKEIAAKSQQYIAAKAVQRKDMGRFLAKPKQPRQQMEPTPSQSQLLSSEITINDKSRYQKDLLTFEYTIILTLYFYVIINEG